MHRRRFVLAAACLSIALDSLGQQKPPKVHRVGVLSAETPDYEQRRLDILRTELRKMGYVEGRTLAIDARFAEGKYDRLQNLAAELVALNVDVIVTSGSKAGLAAKKATSRIPIVVSNMGDAVDANFIGNYAQPGGNVTGMSGLGSESVAKQLDMLKQVKPQLGIVAVLLNPANPNFDAIRRILTAEASRQRIRLEPIEVRTAMELPGIVGSLNDKHVDGLMVVSDTMFSAHGKTIAELASGQRIASTGTTQFAHDGGLLGYSSNRIESWRHLMVYVDKILKGAKPGDLPVEQPTRVDLVINLKTAKAIGIAVPQALLLRADEVIE